MVLIHRLIYGVWVQPDVMFEYVLDVPGPLPIDPFTSVLLLSAAFRRDLVAGVLLFAAASYSAARESTCRVPGGRGPERYGHLRVAENTVMEGTR